MIRNRSHAIRSECKCPMCAPRLQVCGAPVIEFDAACDLHRRACVLVAEACGNVYGDAGARLDAALHREFSDTPISTCREAITAAWNHVRKGGV